MFLKENAKDVIIKKLKSGTNLKTYIFECIDCGKDIKLQAGRFKSHSGKCIQCSQRGKPYSHILNELIFTCKKRNKHIVTLTYDEFIDIITDAKCHYCNKELIYNKYTRDENLNYVSRAYQLDRKNNDLGYTKENVVPCCWECNRLKSNIYTYKEFMRFSPILKEIQQERCEVK